MVRVLTTPEVYQQLRTDRSNNAETCNSSREHALNHSSSSTNQTQNKQQKSQISSTTSPRGSSSRNESSSSSQNLSSNTLSSSNPPSTSVSISVASTSISSSSQLSSFGAVASSSTTSSKLLLPSGASSGAVASSHASSSSQLFSKSTVTSPSTSLSSQTPSPSSSSTSSKPQLNITSLATSDIYNKSFNPTSNISSSQQQSVYYDAKNSQQHSVSDQEMLPYPSSQRQSPPFNSKYKVKATVESPRNEIDINSLNVNEMLTKPSPPKDPLYLDPGPFRSNQDQAAMTTSQDAKRSEDSFLPDMNILLSTCDQEEPLLVTSQPELVTSHRYSHFSSDRQKIDVQGQQIELQDHQLNPVTNQHLPTTLQSIKQSTPENSLIEEHEVDSIEPNSIDKQLANDTKQDNTDSLSDASCLPAIPDIASLLNEPAAMSTKYRDILEPVQILTRIDTFNQINLKRLIRNLIDENAKLKSTIEENNEYLKDQMINVEKWMRSMQILEVQAEKNKDKTGKDDVAPATAYDGGGAEGGGGPVGGMSSNEETNIQLHNLSTQLDVAEESQAQLSQDLQRVTGEKMELINRVSTLQMELEERRIQGDEAMNKLEHLEKDKWELGRVNGDLQQRLQQTVALAHMQAEGNDSRLHEEVGKLLAQLEEEREVTARLSTSLELERRKLESLEQKSKGASGKKEASRRRSSLIPEEVRETEGRLIASMEMYRQRCENLGSRISGCQQQLERDTWQQPELGLEITKLWKLLAEEKRSCLMEAEKLREVHQLFEQVYQEYASSLETIKQSHHEKKLKHQQQNNSVMENIKESNIRDNMDSLTARLMNTEDALNRERLKTDELQDRLRQSENQLEAIPILEAQVEVYRSDFNAEREARERIAGEKADLAEELTKYRKPTGGMSQNLPTRNNSMHQHQQRNHQPQQQQYQQQPQQHRQAQPQQYHNNQHHHNNGEHNNFDYRNDFDGGRGRQGGDGRHGGGGGEGRHNGGELRRRDTSRGGGNEGSLRERVNHFDDRGDDNMLMAQIPLTVNQHSTQRNGGLTLDEPSPDLNCPKCNREFRNTTLLTRHVNDCLDRDY